MALRPLWFVVLLALAGCANAPRPRLWQSLDASSPARWEVDRSSVVRTGDHATIVLRTSLFDDNVRAPRSPRVVFESLYRFDCRARTFVLLPSWTYNPVMGWRPLPGSEASQSLDSPWVRKYQPPLYTAQTSAFAIACAPPSRSFKARPGNRLS